MLRGHTLPAWSPTHHDVCLTHIGFVNSGTSVQQSLHHFHMAILSSDVQRSGPGRLHGPHNPHGTCKAHVGTQHSSAVHPRGVCIDPTATAVHPLTHRCLIHSGVGVHQRPDHTRVPLLCGRIKWRGSITLHVSARTRRQQCVRSNRHFVETTTMGTSRQGNTTLFKFTAALACSRVLTVEARPVSAAANSAVRPST